MTWRASFVFAALMVACAGSSGGGEGGNGATGDDGGTGGDGGAGGTSGDGGTGDADLCAGVSCGATECKTDGVCDASDGVCDYTPIADGTPCSEGECRDGACAPIGAFPCTEQGIRDAIAEGGGPHFFACDGPTTVMADAEILIDNDVILDGEGELALAIRGRAGTCINTFEVATNVTAGLHGFNVTGGCRGMVNRGMLTVANSTFSANSIGIQNRISGTLTVTGGTFSGNNGAIENYQGIATVTSSAVSNNGHGYNSASTIVNDDGTMTLANTTVSGNLSVISVIENTGMLAVTNTTISGNAAENGIFNNPYYGGTTLGTLTVTNSTVSRNDFDLGAIHNLQGPATLTNSTITGNSTLGGIMNAGTLAVTNVTVSGNTASGAEYAWDGFGLVSSGTLTLTNSTISGNPGGIYNFGTVTLAKNVIDGNCEEDGDTSSTTSTGYNVESPLDTCGFDQLTDAVNVGAEALALGPLADNGGPTETHALLPGSIAIDAIPEAMCEMDEDQRGERRPETGGTMCDVGAFEVQP